MVFPRPSESANSPPGKLSASAEFTELAKQNSLRRTCKTRRAKLTEPNSQSWNSLKRLRAHSEELAELHRVKFIKSRLNQNPIECTVTQCSNSHQFSNEVNWPLSIADLSRDCRLFKRLDSNPFSVSNQNLKFNLSFYFSNRK